MSNTSPFWRHPVVLVAAVLVVIAAAIGAYWFQPWKVVTTTTVDEPVPTSAPLAAPVSAAPPTTPVVLAEGAFISHEHATSGTAKLLRLPDGSQVLRGEPRHQRRPTARGALTDAPVIHDRDGWHVFEQGRHVDLGALKGNRGNANYFVPAGVDIRGLDSVSIWCDRFDVSFGAAELVGLRNAAEA